MGLMETAAELPPPPPPEQLWWSCSVTSERTNQGQSRSGGVFVCLTWARSSADAPLLLISTSLEVLSRVQTWFNWVLL